MEQPECSETSAHKIQTPENNPKKKEYNIQNMAEVWNQETNCCLTSHKYDISEKH